ncbi:MAG: hypothetical protein CO029_03560 [Candidatus Magasanikbacteria bacterium CG_4_9_14_0_2_um_filter_41_10]|uniref:ABC transporter domain-containing protein n=1 Tax=Candidatus Magasanikbacteria bacterium CG_4_10_14_0_2_um_filter_41_31 TaxID=1974639 RepID=A0A2M7V5K3_9BACT|nr:MAG: hypothetical protein AUJ37_02150 [Candidatus Magasanikbacteria bacterium CG1_02_41_34]PIZ93871.1 MAG: hypothetical protein COX83_00680 [Candidatus Magasanikbacteria bacterium CG_4_10_14_0_2_um_filter_41_31]PJC53291.1 MAG: hypothetical protein CO029_03560 [Candidatus Magasanikbacteria bacterium CG_4_9_14_0_2_um_filter_41_10]
MLPVVFDMSQSAAISIKNLSVTYFPGKSNEVPALSNANLDIYPGEFIIFFGPSGCGKSTLLYSIAGLEKPTEGEILVQGLKLHELSNSELEYYHQFTTGMIFQAFYLIPSLSVEKNIMLPQIAVGGKKKERQAEAERLMKYFGVYEQRSKLPNELSGGQQQRVAICRSLINDPDIIFADEPVGNLDSKSAQDVLALIQELNIKQKKTIILVTHDPSHLDIADRVFFMKDGKITDTKKNINRRKITPGQEVATPEPQKTNLELVSDTFTKEGAFGLEGMMMDYKAKEIVAEALTGFTAEEIGNIEHYVKDYLLDVKTKPAALEQYLDEDFLIHNGLSLNKRSASRLTKILMHTAEEMRELHDRAISKHKKKPDYAAELRYYLLDTFKTSLHNTDAIDAMESIINDRIHDRTDRKGVQAIFDLDLARGGAGLDKRLARRMAKHLDLVLLGRYRVENTQIQKKK